MLQLHTCSAPELCGLIEQHALWFRTCSRQSQWP